VQRLADPPQRGIGPAGSRGAVAAIAGGRKIVVGPAHRCDCLVNVVRQITYSGPGRNTRAFRGVIATCVPGSNMLRKPRAVSVGRSTWTSASEPWGLQDTRVIAPARVTRTTLADRLARPWPLPATAWP
jgi:hypothetical protein